MHHSGHGPMRAGHSSLEHSSIRTSVLILLHPPKIHSPKQFLPASFVSTNQHFHLAQISLASENVMQANFKTSLYSRDYVNYFISSHEVYYRAAQGNPSGLTIHSWQIYAGSFLLSCYPSAAFKCLVWFFFFSFPSAEFFGGVSTGWSVILWLPFPHPPPTPPSFFKMKDTVFSFSSLWYIIYLRWALKENTNGSEIPLDNPWNKVHHKQAIWKYLNHL